MQTVENEHAAKFYTHTLDVFKKQNKTKQNRDARKILKKRDCSICELAQAPSDNRDSRKILKKYRLQHLRISTGA
jgi:formate dehydrogenase assembly factor FdhD